jgi:tRNA-dihydrouridine synthase
MGCPAKSEVKNGTCSALILNRPLAGDIIAATQDGLAGRLPLSVKTRVGFHEVDMSWIAFLLKHNLAMLTVHGRTRRQMSRVPADWSLIARARELRDQIAPMTLIVGNGDVMNRQHGESLAARHGLDGIMIGRGIFQNPFAFSKKSDNTWQDYDERMRTALFRKQIELFGVTWQHNERPLKTLNKFCKIYINGFEGAKELREELMSAHSTTELLNYLQPQLARR